MYCVLNAQYRFSDCELERTYMPALLSSSQFQEASRPNCRRLNSDTSFGLFWDVGKFIGCPFFFSFFFFFPPPSLVYCIILNHGAVDRCLNNGHCRLRSFTRYYKR